MSQWNLETIKRSHRRTGSGNELGPALHTERAESHEQLLVRSTLTTGERAPVQCLVSAGGVHGVQPYIRFMEDPSKRPFPVAWTAEQSRAGPDVSQLAGTGTGAGTGAGTRPRFKVLSP